MHTVLTKIVFSKVLQKQIRLFNLISHVISQKERAKASREIADKIGNANLAIRRNIQSLNDIKTANL